MEPPMILANKINAVLNDNSWIRKMYERARALQAAKPGEKIYDLSIGNPVFEPPAAVTEALRKLVNSEKKGLHRYCSNQGLERTRSWVADRYRKFTQLALGADDVVMCTGAGGAINTALNALLDPGDEVLFFRPYFVEYAHYVHNFGGTVSIVDTTPEFRLDFAALEKAITSRTKVIILNSPNNPTGVVYNRSEIRELASLLERKNAQLGSTIVLLSDEPYTRIVYDGISVPSILDYYPHSIIASSFSKDLALAGERIGYLIVSPHCVEAPRVVQAFVTSLRILGFVNAPALMQHILPEVGDAMVDIRPYVQNRDLLYEHLTSIGYECVKPEGAFYLFPRSPVADDVEFIEEALQHNLVLVPGRTFGVPGYFRVSFCFETSFIKETLPLFTKALLGAVSRHHPRTRYSERGGEDSLP